jgi:hypothetical protein
MSTVARNDIADTGGLFVLLLDDMLTSADYAIPVRMIAREFVEHHVGPNDLMAVFSTAGHGVINQEFTHDKARILRVIDRFLGGSCGGTEGENIYRIRVATDVMTTLANHLAGIRGRRVSVLWVSEESRMTSPAQSAAGAGSRREAESRRTDLFLSPTRESLARAETIAGEASRFNLGRLRRNLSYPTMALIYLRQAHQSRSRFEQDGTARVDGRHTSVLRFRETARPSLVRDGADNAVATGRFWIEPDTGRVLRTQVTFDAARTTGTITVAYGPTPVVPFLVPVSLEEEYQVRLGDTPPLRTAEIIGGRGRYSNFRQFRGTARLKEPETSLYRRLPAAGSL